jgi:probable HAF family extracellular repeat protein
MRPITKNLPAILATAAGLAIALPARAQPFFQGLGNIQGAPFPSSHANGISADGLVVVGSSTSPTSFNTEAFWWTAQTGMVGLGFLSGGNASAAYATTFDGSIVVGQSNGTCNEPFRWTLSVPSTGQGVFLGLGDLPGGPCQASAFDVSDDGSVIVGVASPTTIANEAFHWTDPNEGGAGMVGLGTVTGGNRSWATAVSNDGKAVVGFSTVGKDITAFRWTSILGMTDLGDLPGGARYSTANAVSFDGIVVVGTSDSANGIEAFRWTLTNPPTGGGTMVGLGDLPGGAFASEALAVSAGGPIVVGTARTAAGDQAFIWDEVNGMRSLAIILVSEFGLDLTGWNLERATAISADGRTIVGHGTNPSGFDEAWIAHLGDNPCYADCDTTTGLGVLDIFDFLCFQSSFVAGTPYACDCNTTTGPLVCDIFDFLCFQDAFVAGCF